MSRFFRLLTAVFLAALVAACAGNPDSAPIGARGYSGPPITQVVVNKQDRKLHMISGRTVVKSYDIGLGGTPVGPKRFEGDGKTPEGIYFINRFNPQSSYHLSVGINYPSPGDTARARQSGRSPGKDIFIHGRGREGAAAKRAGKRDWTAGCIAVEDAEIEEIYAMLRPGVPVVINR